MKRINITSTLILAGLSYSAGSMAATYPLPPEGEDVIGAVSTVVAVYEDTLVDLARLHEVGYEEIVRANPDVNVWVPGEGTEIVIPTQHVLPSGPRRGIVLNLAEYRMYYFPEPKEGETPVVMTYPMSIGRVDWETPLGYTRVTQKVVNPSWYPPKSVRAEHAADGDPLPAVVPPGPDNPLGKHAMRLSIPGYLIHGTNKPGGVGMRVTHGCLRMFPENIKELFPLVPVDTPVRIVNEPVKIGWSGDTLVLEVHPVLESAPETTTDEPVPEPVEEDSGLVAQAAEADDVAASVDADVMAEAEADEPVETVAEAEFAEPEKSPLTYVTEQYIVATRERPGELNWTLVEDVVERADGLPVTVGVGRPVIEEEVVAAEEDSASVSLESHEAGIKNAATSAASQ
jgi:L,D-transpeptidase ErfK/SrfK